MFSQQNSVILDKCVACGSTHLELVLDLGTQPLANSYKDTKEEVQEEFPLAINRCKECSHVQLTHAVNPELMFKDYAYVSGTSKTMHDHMTWFAHWTTEFYRMMVQKDPQDVLDIGCNDGTQLDKYKMLFNSMRTFGVDPAENLHAISSQNHSVFCNFFDKDFTKNNVAAYDMVVAQNVFAHNYNPEKFMSALSDVMKANSLAFVQTSQADMILNNEFDTIYHEHISFYNIKSMQELCNRTGFYLIDVVKCPLHGNSYIFVISKNEKHSRPMHIKNLIDMEKKAGLFDDATYKNYADHCKQIAYDLRELVNGYHHPDAGYYTIGYGAAAKGMTVLNYTGMHLDYIIDDNPLKQGKFTPGSSIPIVSSNILSDIKGPCLFVPLAWNFFDEIKARIESKKDTSKDKFVKYFPEIEVI